MSEYINVEKFKVSQESVYLDLLADCIDGYSFNKIELQVRTYSHNGNGIEETSYLLSDKILSSDDLTSKLVLSIPLASIFGGKENIQPAMYCLILGIIKNTDDVIGLDYYEEEFYTSDVNNAINQIIEEALSLEGSCSTIPDSLIRNYLILYGHLAALESGQQSIAEEYFKILSRNFTKCGSVDGRLCGNCECGSMHIHKTCNCL